MNWPVLIAILVAGTLASFTDWLFMGVLFHDRYNTYPEVWWPGLRDGKDRTGIAWATGLGYLSAAAIVAVCAATGVHDIRHALVIALLAWVAGPMLVLVVNGFFIKLDPLITVAHCAGYLARFLISGLAAGISLA